MIGTPIIEETFLHALTNVGFPMAIALFLLFRLLAPLKDCQGNLLKERVRSQNYCEHSENFTITKKPKSKGICWEQNRQVSF
ncbi:Putative Yvrj family protein [Heliorestis convoluta]|uniref:Yvrj family protein n=1 Tax=Heliorestis convoluta TaxID=356322 RepID=A0A5Q2N1P5_9FIRM|nr:Putative Yvrj family protein [Heliorestis convoluta]